MLTSGAVQLVRIISGHAHTCKAGITTGQRSSDKRKRVDENWTSIMGTHARDPKLWRRAPLQLSIPDDQLRKQCVVILQWVCMDSVVLQWWGNSSAVKYLL